MNARVKATARTSNPKRSNSVSPTRKAGFSQSIGSPIDHIFFLQRTIGNQAVQSLFESGVIQAKLKIGQPGDIYEQEADRVADAVMRMPDPVASLPAQLNQEEPQCRPIEEEEKLRRQPEEEELEQDEAFLQTKASPGTVPELDDNFEELIRNLRCGSQPLPQSERDFFEPRIGHDFTGVRIHNDSNAGSMARFINARAFTLGHDVVFGEGEYSPGTTEGRRLLGHELTHVVQQGGAERAPQVGRKPAEERTYTVKPGDSLRKLAKKFGVTQVELVTANADKVRTWPTTAGKKITGFNAGETIVIPAPKEAPGEKKPEKSIWDYLKGMAGAVGGTLKEAWDWLSGLGREEEKEAEEEETKPTKRYITVKSGVVLTERLQNAINILEGYFATADLPVVVTSGVRTAERQLRIIVYYVKKHGLDKKYPSILEATVDDEESWRGAWDELLNIKNVIVNPPKEAKCELGKRAGRSIGLSPHQRGAAIDFAGALLASIENVVKSCKTEGGPIGQVLPEPKNGCIHVGIT